MIRTFDNDCVLPIARYDFLQATAVLKTNHEPLHYEEEWRSILLRARYILRPTPGIV